MKFKKGDIVIFDESNPVVEYIVGFEGGLQNRVFAVKDIYNIVSYCIKDCGPEFAEICNYQNDRMAKDKILREAVVLKTLVGEYSFCASHLKKVVNEKELFLYYILGNGALIK